MTPDECFSGSPQSKKLFAAVACEIEAIGQSTTRVTKSQVAFRRRRTFAAVWMPAQYLKRQSAPLVLTIYLRHRNSSPRWKQIVQPAPGRFTHHLELYDPAEIDEDVGTWLREAWVAVG